MGQRSRQKFVFLIGVMSPFLMWNLISTLPNGRVVVKRTYMNADTNNAAMDTIPVHEQIQPVKSMEKIEPEMDKPSGLEMNAKAESEVNETEIEVQALTEPEVNQIDEPEVNANDNTEVNAEDDTEQKEQSDHKASESGKQYDLRIIAMVYNRGHSLLRLLDSLNAADYFNDKIKLEVKIDRSKWGGYNETVHKMASNFQFHHGDYSVHVHPTHVGIYGQWFNAWIPVENSSEIALIVEDDMQVSPFYYRYLKAVHKKYDNNPNINGFALQGYSRILSSSVRGDLKAPYEHSVFLYPILGCWGFSPSAKNWAGFLKWVKPTLDEGNVKPYVPGTVLTDWYKGFEKHGNQHSMWEMWHTYYAYLNKENTLYCNLKGHEGFSTNWREAGLHSGKGRKKTGTPSNALVTNWNPAFDDLPDNPVQLNLDAEIIN